MAQQMMWNMLDQVYRGQASDGTVVMVDEDAMLLAHKKAGKGVYESDWWTETLGSILEHWGIFGKRWMDETTGTPRMHFKTGEPKSATSPTRTTSMPGPLSTRLISGPLSVEAENGKRDA